MRRASGAVSTRPRASADAEAIRFLTGLVSTPSVSGCEAAATALFASEAAALGFQTEIDAAGNAIASTRSGGGREIVLLGHIDTVPGDIPVRVERGVLHGRGAVDAKGPLAAFLYAAARARLPRGVRCRVVAAVGEEAPESVGARYLRDRLRPDACVIGEPSGWDGVTLGYKGRLVAHARCVQDCAHSAGPAGSAADTVHRWWSGVVGSIEELAAGGPRVFDRVQASIRTIATSTDGLRDTCVLTGGFRLPPGVSPEELEAHIRRRTSGAVELRFEGHLPACVTGRADPVVRALTASIRSRGGVARPKVKTGTADLNVVGPAWRCPIAAYGPGDSALDHTPDERLHLDEYLRAIDVLVDALEGIGAELAASAP